MDTPSKDELTSHFFWTPEDVEQEQIEQIGVSACGATAVINVLVREIFCDLSCLLMMLSYLSCKMDIVDRKQVTHTTYAHNLET